MKAKGVLLPCLELALSDAPWRMLLDQRQSQEPLQRRVWTRGENLLVPKLGGTQ